MVSVGWFWLSLPGVAQSPWLSSTSSVDGSGGSEPEILGRIVWGSPGEGTLLGSLSGEVRLPLFCGDIMGVGGDGRSHMVAS